MDDIESSPVREVPTNDQLFPWFLAPKNDEKCRVEVKSTSVPSAGVGPQSCRYSDR